MISKFFIDRPRFAFVISIVITIAGIIAIKQLPVAQYPQITPPQVSITANYPGANADVVQKTVIEPIEEQVNGVKRMLYMSSQSSDDGTATITVTFEIGSDGDINTMNVSNRVNIALPRLPQQVRNQGITVQEKSSNMLLVINLYSPNNSMGGIALNNYMAINLQDAITRVPGVAQANILSDLTYSMRLWLDPDKLTSLKMSVDEVITAIEEQNAQVAAGYIGAEPAPKGQLFQYTILTKGRLSDAKEFGNIIIRATNDGAIVRVKDVARVDLGAESYTSKSDLNGQPCAMMVIYQLAEANGMQVAEDIKTLLAKYKSRFKKDDVECSICYDTTKFIKASIDEVVLTLFEAVALVILVTFIFLQDWRSTLVPTIAIPVSLIGTFAVLLAAGYSINLVTLFGLILAIGIVVDDAIVVIENVNRLMEDEGLPPKDAAKKTMEQVTAPVIATTLVLMACFIPVCFLPGITGVLYRQFAVTISVSVFISSINALTLSPALCATLLRPGGPKVWYPFKLFNRFFDWLTTRYSAIVSLLVRKAIIVVITFFILMGLTYKLYSDLPTGFVPNEDQGAFFVDVQLPDCASLERTTEVVSKARDIFRKIPGVADVNTCIGYSIIAQSTASNTAFMIVTLKDWSVRTKASENQFAIINTSRKELNKIQSANIMPFPTPAIPGLGTTGGFNFVLQDLFGSDQEKLAEAMRGIVYEANQQPDLKGVFSTFRSNVPHIYLEIDRDKVKKLGISFDTLYKTIQSYFGSYYINDFNKFGKVYKVYIEAEKNYRSDITDIGGAYVKNTQGDMVPLNTILKINTTFSPQVQYRYNMYSNCYINGDAAPGYSSGQAMKTMEKLAKTLPDDMTYSWTDISYQEKLAGNLVLIIFALAILFIYLFLVAQYESWMIPFAVMLSVPVAFFGAIGALWLLGLTNNIYTQVGFVLLFGLASKTAILIVEFAKEKHKEGLSIIESARFAAKLRFRAVVMTAVSFILGVTPLVIAVGAGAASRRCLGTAVFGGMLIAGIFGTILIPSFYVIVQSLIEWGSKKAK